MHAWLLQIFLNLAWIQLRVTKKFAIVLNREMASKRIFHDLSHISLMSDYCTARKRLVLFDLLEPNAG